MKRIRKLLTLCLVLCLLSGCGAARGPQVAETTSAVTQTAPETTPETTTETTETTTAVPNDLPPVDVDLTQLPQNLMYSQAYEIIYNTEQYLGKTVRISGPYSVYTDPETNETHRACLIRDATACCTQGMEFEPADQTQPLPEAEAIITVSGVFDTYMSGPFLYCILRNARIES